MKPFRINAQKKLYEFEDGSSVPIPEDQVPEILGNVAGKNPKGLAIKEATKQRLREEKKRMSFGSDILGSIDTAFTQGASNIASAPEDYLSSIYDAYKNEDKSERGFLSRVHENYAPRREGRKEFKEELLAKEPIASYIGKGLGLAGEVAATAGLPGYAAAPILGFAESQTSLFEPGKVALEAVTDAALGGAIDWGIGKLSKLAGRRGARQAEKAGIENIKSQNATTEKGAGILNAQEAKRFAQESAAREAQVAAIPGQQAANQQAFSQGVAKNVEKIGDALGSAKLPEAALGIEEFIVNNIERSAHAGTPEGNKVAKFVQTIFNSKGKGVDKSHLNQAFQALEGRIAATEGVEKELLLKLKDEMTATLSHAIPEAAIYSKYGEPVANAVIKETESFVKKLVSKSDPEAVSQISKTLGGDFGKALEDSIKNDIQSVFQKHSTNFTDAIQNGTISSEVMQILTNNPIINGIMVNPSQYIDKKTVGKISKSGFNVNQSSLIDKFSVLRKNLEHLPQTVANEIEQNFAKNLNKIARDKVFETQGINKLLPNIQGAAQSIPQPGSVRPAINVQPNLQQVPQLSEAQGPAQTFANFMEDSSLWDKLKRVKGMFGGAGGASAAAALGKMAGIPIAKTVGGATLATVGGDLLTRNSAGGAQARTALKQGLLQSYLTAKAQVFPSFREGILDDPNDRRMFVREIEDDPSLSIEDKAMMQTKINRGQSL